MSQYDEVSRFKHHQQSKDWRYQQWSKADAAVMLEGLAAALTGTSEHGTLRAYKAIDDQGYETLWLCVVDEDDSLTTYVLGFNNSHPCPPLC